jgi:glycosyltransferase involved in cell wall biosynthesis
LKSISFLIASLSGSGGTQRMLTLLVNKLVNDFNISIFVNQPGKPFYKLDYKANVKELPEGIFKKNIFIYKCLKKTKASYYINLDSNSVLLNGFLLPQFTRLIIWEHFSLESNYNKLLFKFSRKYATLVAYKLVLLSQNEQNIWQKYIGINTSKIEVIKNPISISEEKIDKSYKFKKKRVLAIGNNANVKGFDLLIEAWLKIKTDWELIIVGLTDVEIKSLTDNYKINYTSKIKLFGKTKDINKFYASSSIFVLSSRKEASPLVLIESQNFGLPAIIFNHLTSAKELVDDSALLANFNYPVDSLKTEMENLIKNEQYYKKLHENALKNSKHFGQDEFINTWKNILAND